MTKQLFLIVAIAVCSTVSAQPWLPVDKTGPIKYTDALKSYYQYRAQNIDEEPENDKDEDGKESPRDLFERWNWYWQQHLDKDGYMVSPMRNLTEWQKYMQAHKRSAARTTRPSNWIFEGPNSPGGVSYSGMGRVNVVAFDPVDSNTFYAGSGGGGTWKTIDGGVTWTPLYDFLPTLGVADIKVNPLNRNTIFVATGDGDASDAFSSGVIVSYDRGVHWSTTGLSWTPTTHSAARSLIINPLDTTSMLLASSTGIFKTNDGGITWTNVRTGNFKQILFHPADTSVVYATSEDGVPSSQVYRSTDGGATWSVVTSFAATVRIALAVCPASPALVLAMASNYSGGLDGIYKSTDNGASFTTLVADATCRINLLGWDLLLPTGYCNGQAEYDMCIAMNPSNPSEITVGGASTFYSSDGGATWTLCGLDVHTDKHYLAYNSLTGALFETSDGGVSKIYGAPTGSWTNLSNGLYITEFYRNAVDNRVTFCLGGSQDNGTKMLTGGGAFSDLTCCDAMQPLINYGDPSHIWYTSNQNGKINMTRDAGTTFNVITASLSGGGGWITPYALHPFDTATLLLGYKQMFVSHNNGTTWDTLSPVFAPYNYIDRIVIATTNPNYIYTVNFDGMRALSSVIHYTPDFGVTWDTISTPFASYISDIVIDPKNERRIWVTISEYGVSKVWKYDMASNIWTDETGTLPDIPVACIMIDSATQTQYIGTNAAVFYKDTSMTDWALFNNNLPTVQVTDLHINYTTNEIWAATYGRGMWKSNTADTRSTLNVLTANMDEKLTITPNPNSGVFFIQSENNRLGNGPLSIRLIAPDGTTVWQTEQRTNNSGTIRIDAKGVKAGVYICVVNSSGRVFRNKIIIY